MSKRKQKYSHNAKLKKETFRQKQKIFSPSKTPDRINQDYRKIRVIQKNLIYVIGLTQNIYTSQILQSNLYFGRYGKVTKTILNKSQIYHSRNLKNLNLSAYITYENQIQASLAIIALDDFKITQRPLKVSFGTTKYCSYFTKNQDCPNIIDCCYLHNWELKNQITVVDQNSKHIFIEQIKTALQIVNNNLRLVFSKRKQQDEIGFPKIQKAVEILVRENYISEQRLKELRNESNREQKVSMELVRQQQMQIKKTNSLSTISSPISRLDSINMNDEEVNNLDEIVERSLINRMMNQSMISKSKLKFVKSGSVSDEEQNIKNYVQRYIIFKNI